MILQSRESCDGHFIGFGDGGHSSEPRTGARPPLGLAPSEVASMPVRLRLCPG